VVKLVHICTASVLGKQRHMCVNNLPKIVIWQCPGSKSNVHTTSELQVWLVTVTSPSHYIELLVNHNATSGL